MRTQSRMKQESLVFCHRNIPQKSQNQCDRAFHASYPSRTRNVCLKVISANQRIALRWSSIIRKSPTPFPSISLKLFAPRLGRFRVSSTRSYATNTEPRKSATSSISAVPPISLHLQSSNLPGFDRAVIRAHRIGRCLQSNSWHRFPISPPDCIHRSFTDLIAKRGYSHAGQRMQNVDTFDYH